MQARNPNTQTPASGHSRTNIQNPKRLFALAVLGLAMLGLALLSNQSAAAGVPTGGMASASSKLYGQLKDVVARADANARLRVIVHMRDQVDLSTWPASDRAGALLALRNKATTGQVAVRQLLGQSDMAANIYQSYWIFNGFAVEAPAATIQALAARDDVDYILEDGYMTMPKYKVEASGPDNPTSNWNIYQVRAPETWALGYDGAGRVLANLDTGVDGSHEALSTRWRGINGGTPANSWLDPFGLSPSFPTDEDVHGTHTMGTIAGYQGDSTGTNEIGQAKGATWIACRIYDSTGKGPFSYIHACFQFMTDPDGNPNTNDQPDSVGNSWNDINSYQYPDLEWWTDMEVWRAVGIIPVFSAGNSGSSASTVGKPAAYPIDIAVGNITQSRIIASSSSRGPAPNLPPFNNPEYYERTDKGLIKPEVVAPGSSVRSSIPGGYGNLSGTSMASPHVTGLAGILRQIRPTLTMNEFYNIIIDTAYFTPTWGVRPNNNYGWGEIDDYAAAIYVRDAGAVSGPIMDTACDEPVVGAQVWVYDNTAGSRAQHVGIRKMLSDNDGNYSTILAAGTYTVSVTAPGYYGVNIPTTVMSSTTGTLAIMLDKMPVGTVSGTVTDGSTGIVGAVVSIDGLSNIRTTTGAGGAYTLSNVPDGTFTIRAEKCGYNPSLANITVTYPGSQVHNFILTGPTALINDDFEDGDLTGWTVSGGSATTAIWHNSDRRGYNSTRAARAGLPIDPFFYTGVNIDTRMESAVYDTSTADRVWLSFDVYDDSESEYDVIRADISTDAGATWPISGTVFGEASPVHGWQNICLDVTQFRSANMKIRFRFTTDGTNWNNEQFEGPSIDNVRLAVSTGNTVTPIVAMTPTPGTPVPCTPVGEATATSTPQATATVEATATACAISFTDVPNDHTFYANIRCLACRGIISGYSDGTFKPGNEITRGQIAKMVSNAAGFSEDPGPQIFEDVDGDNTFYAWVNRLSMRGHMGGYPCGGEGEPCNPPGNRPYFRPFANATRGQLAKIVANAAGIGGSPTGLYFADVPEDNPFYVWIMRLTNLGVMGGYPCGGEGEPCDDQDRPYFRPYTNVTRGQASKIVANTFYPNCETPSR
ncbi:MAG TPA: S8 family serine peptidase [Chloroflexia bacterium]|nr:S8 family serine peptidase [Chloroflexia bacterium]